MNINRNNYESWFLDLSENRLSAEQVAEVLLFLEKNPELKEEFELLSDEVTIDPGNYSMGSKEKLKHILDKSQEDEELLIAYLENDLSEHDRRILESRIEKDEGLSLKFAQYKTLFLQPEAIEIEKMPLKQFTSGERELFFAAYHEGDLSVLQKEQVENYVRQHPEANSELRAFSMLTLKPDDEIIYSDKASLKKKKGVLISMYSWISVAAAAVIIFLFFFPTKDIPEALIEQTAAVHTFTEEDNNEESIAQMSIEDEVAEDEKIYVIAVEEGTPTPQLDVSPPKKKVFPKLIKRKETSFEKPALVADQGRPEESQQESKPIEQKVDKEVNGSDMFDDHIRIADQKVEGKSTEELIASVSNTEKRNNAFHVLDLVERAGENSKLFDFQSNHKSAEPVRETKFSLGKFSITRKTRRKTRS